MRGFVFFLLACTLRADDLTNKMTARVSEEAAAFLKAAPEILGTETLNHSEIKPPARFHPRVGAGANTPTEIQWIQRQIVSEYGFSSFASASGASPAVHELRQITSVDGKKINDRKKAQDTLAAAITASHDAQKRALLKDFEKVGLAAAATDFGQLLLLFTRRDIDRYEFTQRPAMMIGYDRALVWSYKQLDNRDALTLFEPKQARRLKIEGEIRVRASDLLPLEITLMTHEGDSPQSVREEAAVTYSESPYGTLLPHTTEHRELRNGKVVMENHFTYSDFHKFGASSGISFPQ
jgi:hypothetical protein